MIRIEIEKFTLYNLNKMFNGKRRVKGTFKHKDSDEIFTGDEFDCLNVHDDALESYRCAIAYFNHTITQDNEKERIAISAEWVKEGDE